MAKPTGFMEHNREVANSKESLERIKNWNEFTNTLPIEKQEIQASRCMDCGTPFCSTGISLNNMVSGCPLNNLIPEWNDLGYRKLWDVALERLLKTNCFPEFTARVCPAPCEGSCTLSLINPAVTIKSNEYTIIETAFNNDLIKPINPIKRTGKKVAVVGSGPSGLAAAFQLNRVGHSVTVYERDDRPGGLLMYGIPNMKLEKDIVLRRVNLMEEEGVKFITNCEIGKDYSAEKLNEEYDAIILCCGSTNPRDLNVEGRQLKGVHFAMEFLKANTKSLLDSKHADNNFIDAKNKDIIVIGGGDTGTDCVGTSIRHGCKSVTQLEILPCPPSERLENNPWPQWPKIFKTDYGQQEAIDLFGKDPREFSIMTKKFVGDIDGNIKEVHTVNIEWKKDENGRFVPVELPETYKVWPAQLVLLSMGFLGPESTLVNALNIDLDGRGNVCAQYDTFKTNVNKFFVAGDMRRGQSLVVWAMKEGLSVARECDRYLMGNTFLT
jgi:glutamate synthase (NADPH) small chain